MDITKVEEFVNKQANYLIAFLCQAIEDKCLEDADSKYLKTAVKQSVRSMQKKIMSQVEHNGGQEV